MNPTIVSCCGQSHGDGLVFVDSLASAYSFFPLLSQSREIIVVCLTDGKNFVASPERSGFGLEKSGVGARFIWRNCAERIIQIVNDPPVSPWLFLLFMKKKFRKHKIN